MKSMKKLAVVALTMAMAVGTTITAHADYSLRFLFGTEKAYGENTTPTGVLYEAPEDSDYSNLGSFYYIVPKTDTITFDLSDSHNVEISWWLNGVAPQVMEDGSIGIWWEDVPEKTVNYVAGTEYSVFPPELQESAKGNTAMMRQGSEPFIIMTVTDYDIDWRWYSVYQVVDNWPGPVGASEAAESADAWESDEHGWRVRSGEGYLANAWYQSPASGLWYYLGSDSYMLTNTTTPDGYTVNADGVWIP